MPLIKVDCPKCTKTYKLSQSFAGKKLICKKCQTVFMVGDYTAKTKPHQTSSSSKTNQPTPTIAKPSANEKWEIVGGVAKPYQVVSPSVLVQPAAKTDKSSANKNRAIDGKFFGAVVLLLATIIVGFLLVLYYGANNRANSTKLASQKEQVPAKSNNEKEPYDNKERVGQQNNITIDPKITTPDDGKPDETDSNVPAEKNQPSGDQMPPNSNSAPAAQANNSPPTQLILPTSAKNYAFLVGVKQYQRTELTNLKYSEFDVTELADVLRQSGYQDRNVELLTQAEGVKDINKLPTSTNIRYALELLLKGLNKSDTVVIAFSGHGVQFAGDSANYFCPMDASLSDQESLISLESVFQQLEECGASGRVLLVDACRDDPQTQLAKTGKRIQLEPIKSRRPPTLEGGTVALFSCSEGEQSFEDPKLKKGVFFHYVIRGMRGEADLLKDGNVTAKELETFVTNQVKNYVRSELNQLQIPSCRGGSEVKGEIVLVSKYEPALKK